MPAASPPYWSAVRSSSVPVQWTGLSPELLVPLDRDGPRPAAHPAGAGAAGGDPGRPAAAGRAAAVLPGAGPRPRASPAGWSSGLLRPAAGRGLPGRPGRLGHPGRRRRQRPPAAPAAAAAGAPRPGCAVDFRPAVPDLASFPRADWAWAVRRGVPVGRRPRRSTTATRAAPTVLRDGAGQLPAAGSGRAAADPDRIVVCTGFSQGLNLALATLAGRGVDAGRLRGSRVRRDRPRSPPSCAGLSVVRVPVDELGLRRGRAGRVRRGRGRASPRPTSGRPASCCRRRGGRRWPPGPGDRRRGWSRTTTTPSSATTGSRSEPCRASPRTGWSRSAR